MAWRKIATCGLALGALGVVGAGQAEAADWSPPRAAATAPALGSTALAGSPTGGATLLFNRNGTLFARTIGRKGKLGARKRIATRVVTDTRPAVAVDATGARYVAWYTTDAAGIHTLHARRIGPRGRLGATRRVATAGHTGDSAISIAAGKRGATIGWNVTHHESDSALKSWLLTESAAFVRQIGPRGRLGRKSRLPGGRIEVWPRPVAWGNRTSVAWLSRGDTSSDLRAAAVSQGGVVERPQTVSAPPASPVTGLAAVAATAAGAMVAWTVPLPEAAMRDPDVLVAARRVSWNGQLGPVLELAPAGPHPGTVDVTSAGSGTQTATWLRCERPGTTCVVQARTIDARDGLGRVHDLSTPMPLAGSPRIVPGPSQGSVAIWTRHQPHWQGEGEWPSTAIEARGIGADGVVGPLQALTAGYRDSEIRDLQVAADGAGNVFACWSAWVGPNARLLRISRLGAG